MLELNIPQIPNRTQFKHVLHGPKLRFAQDAPYFPSIVDTVMAGDWEAANKTVNKVAGILKQAAANLVI